jgi:hypothetical protein
MGPRAGTCNGEEKNVFFKPEFEPRIIQSVVKSLYRLHCPVCLYRGADKSLARPGRKQATATEDFDVHISYLLS